MNYQQDIYKLAHIKRYSTMITIHDESVAEHGFMVAALLFDLYHKYKFSLQDAVTIAICHDMAEIELNDCPHVIKRDYPKIKEAFDECEKEVAKMFPESVQVAIQLYKDNNTIEAKMVHLADVIQCVQYSRSEMQLGNRGYLEQVFLHSLQRQEKLEAELEQYKR